MSQFFGGAVPKRSTSSTNAVVTGKGRLKGIHAYGGTAVFTIYDSLTQAGTVIIDPTSSAAGGYIDFGDEGIAFVNGLSVTFGAGLTACTLYVSQ